ncbi:uncharacterized protein LOC143223311 [Tachypleus tridentatus]|uniref:uncharacterized protein LOC143223311 n=1 Tax=Tachypleus tridentatus TaxID=6853 RepID=UPI003FD4FB2B
MTKICPFVSCTLTFLCWITLVVCRGQCLPLVSSENIDLWWENLDDVDESDFEAEVQYIRNRILDHVRSLTNMTRIELEKPIQVKYRRVVEEQDEHQHVQVFRFKDIGSLSQMDTRNFKLLNVYFLPNVKELSSNFSVTSASLHIYRSRGSSFHFPLRSTLNNSIHFTKANILTYQYQERMDPIKNNHTQPLVSVYRLINTSVGQNHKLQILVTSRKLDLQGPEGWETFDVSSAVESWLTEPESKFELQIVCSNCDFVFMSMNNSLEARSFFQQNFTLDKSLSKAILEIGLSERSRRLPRNIRHSKRYPMDCTHGKKTKRCCRYKMKVSFQSIPLKGTGWESIIEPKEFDAFVCKGKCNKRYRNVLNRHALLQNRLRRIMKDKIPRLCCTSKKRKPLMVKVIDSHSQRREGKLDDMIVTECGCG